MPAFLGARPELLLATDDRGDMSGAAGLAASIKWPTTLPVRDGVVEVLYEWMPPDGREATDGPVLKGSLAEMLIPANMRRLEQAADAWINVHVPAGFRGIVQIDVEKYGLFEGVGRYDHDLEAEARIHPSWTHGELLCRFVREVAAMVRARRPGASCGWYGLGLPHPGRPFYDNTVEDHRRVARRDAAMVLGTAVRPFCPLYHNNIWPSDPSQRRRSREFQGEVIKLIYGMNAPQSGMAMAQIRNRDVMTNKVLTAEQTHELISDLKAIGFRRFVLWHAFESRDDRDLFQAWVDARLAPAWVDAFGAAPVRPSA